MPRASFSVKDLGWCLLDGTGTGTFSFSVPKLWYNSKEMVVMDDKQNYKAEMGGERYN